MDAAVAMRFQGVITADNALRAETDLVARARQGDPRAFEALISRHMRAVLNLAYRIVSDRDAAEDVAQEAFINAYRQLARFRGDSGFATWLYRITVNEARMHLRSVKRRQARTEKLGLYELAQPEMTEIVEEGGPLTELLQELPEKQRVAMALFYLQELSLQEIAAAASAPTGTVKAWLSRGRTALRELAEERGLL